MKGRFKMHSLRNYNLEILKKHQLKVQQWSENEKINILRLIKLNCMLMGILTFKTNLLYLIHIIAYNMMKIVKTDLLSLQIT